MPLSFDQKPTDPRELSRIVEAGGFVTTDGEGRLSGSIGVARAVGDIDLKQRVKEEDDEEVVSILSERERVCIRVYGKHL